MEEQTQNHTPYLLEVILSFQGCLLLLLVLPHAFITAFVPQRWLVSRRKSRHFGRHVFVRSERPEMTCLFQTPRARNQKSFEELETLICACLFQAGLKACCEKLRGPLTTGVLEAPERGGRAVGKSLEKSFTSRAHVKSYRPVHLLGSSLANALSTRRSWRRFASSWKIQYATSSSTQSSLSWFACRVLATPALQLWRAAVMTPRLDVTRRFDQHRGCLD